MKKKSIYTLLDQTDGIHSGYCKIRVHAYIKYKKYVYGVVLNLIQLY